MSLRFFMYDFWTLSSKGIKVHLIAFCLSFDARHKRDKTPTTKQLTRYLVGKEISHLQSATEYSELDRAMAKIQHL